MIKKLRSRSGESIAETLIALLVSALALMMLAGAVSAATNVVTKSKAKMTEYYAADQLLTEAAKSTNTLTVTMGGYTFDGVPYVANTTFPGTEVIAYEMPTPTPSAAPAGS